MPSITIETDIAAPPMFCFDLARSVEAHVETARDTRERAVAGQTSGLLELGDEVTWRARHLGVTQHLTSRIVAFDPPKHFRDSMVRGAFELLTHDHGFVAIPGGTRMTDVLSYRAPLGLMGRLAEALFLTAYLRRFLQRRAQVLKSLAESDEWRQFVRQAEETTLVNRLRT